MVRALVGVDVGGAEEADRGEEGAEGQGRENFVNHVALHQSALTGAAGRVKAPRRVASLVVAMPSVIDARVGGRHLANDRQGQAEGEEGGGGPSELHGVSLFCVANCEQRDDAR